MRAWNSGADGETKLLQDLSILYSRSYVGLLRDELSDLRALGMTVLVEQRLDALKKRFCDLSLFVKEVKERFSRWFSWGAGSLREASSTRSGSCSDQSGKQGARRKTESDAPFYTLRQLRVRPLG